MSLHSHPDCRATGRGTFVPLVFAAGEAFQFDWSEDWAAFIRSYNLEHSMSRRANCHDNAVADSFFSSLKRERIRRRTYKAREEACQDMFDYVEMFYNPVRKQFKNGMLSHVEFERQQILKAEGL
jgi:putative transposase